MKCLNSENSWLEKLRNEVLQAELGSTTPVTPLNRLRPSHRQFSSVDVRSAARRPVVIASQPSTICETPPNTRGASLHVHPTSALKWSDFLEIRIFKKKSKNSSSFETLMPRMRFSSSVTTIIHSISNSRSMSMGETASSEFLRFPLPLPNLDQIDWRRPWKVCSFFCKRIILKQGSSQYTNCNVEGF